IQVIKAPMPGHSHINCIGHVCDKDVPLLSLIQPGDTFKFVYTKENNK
ncbi:MAG: phospho-sugar glycosidase domain-containing protein, partial [Staphylococcus epidermidis]|nr:phospho-sugar glycosidase domain-containing protein [Staphylococcus epidermidis]